MPQVLFKHFQQESAEPFRASPEGPRGDAEPKDKSISMDARRPAPLLHRSAWPTDYSTNSHSFGDLRLTLKMRRGLIHTGLGGMADACTTSTVQA